MSEVALPLPRRPLGIHAYASLTLLMAGGLVVLAVWSGASLGSVEIVSLLALAGIAAQKARIRLGVNIEQSLALLPLLCAGVLFGPVAGAIVGGASLLTEMRASTLRWVIYSSGRATNGILVGAGASLIAPSISHELASIAVTSIACALLAETFDVAFAALTFYVRGNNPRGLLATLVPLSATAVPIFATMIALFVLTYRNVSPWAMLAFIFPAIGVQRLYLLYEEQRSAASELIEANGRLRQTSLSFAEALIAAVDARDSYTAGHSAAVAIYARDIVAKLGYGLSEQRLAYECGLVHDIGKISLPLGVIEKRGPLSADERRLMEGHPVSGEEMLSRIDEFDGIARAVRHHHERFDGGGYPDALVGDDIPFLARVIAVADSYNAMTSDRPYRDALQPSVASSRLLEGAGSQFDPDVVEAFLSVLRNSSLSYCRGDFLQEEMSSVPEERCGVSASSLGPVRASA